MKYHTDPDHPNVHDYPNGMSVFWSENHPEQIEVITWTNYAPSTGEHNGILSRFSVDETNKTLVLEHVSLKRKYSVWIDGLTNPSRYVSDKVKRAIRKFIADNKGSDYWRVQLFKE